MPRPNVGSAVIRLTLHKDAPVKTEDEKLMFSIIRAAFNQRRKTLQNCLNHFEGLKLDKETVAGVLSEMNINENIRGEALSLEQYAALTDILKSKDI